MQEPIVLGLDGNAMDEELEARAAGIRQRVEAFVTELQELSQRHNVWVDGVEETPRLVDGLTSENAGNCNRDGEGYSVSFDYDVMEPAECRRQWIERTTENERQYEARKRETAERERQQAEEEQRMKAAGYERLKYRFHPAYCVLSPSGTVISPVGTAGGWYNPKTGDVRSGGTPDPREALK